MVGSVLVVEDDAALRNVICRVLRLAGHAVEAAANGGGALRLLESATWDLLVTDIMMPDGDGIELITAAKQTYPAMRILAISGRGFLGTMDLLDVAARLGAHATLRKPFLPEELLAKITELTSPGPAADGA